MDDLRQYIVSVVAGACICGIALGLLPESGTRTILKLLCGMFLAVTVLRPVSNLEIEDFLAFDQILADNASQTAAMGEAYSEKLFRQRIKEETAAYILDKADAMGVKIIAEVGLDEKGIPALVRLSGNLSPYHREVLEGYISRNLSISKENQIWTS